MEIGNQGQEENQSGGPATGLSLSLFFVLGLLYKNVPGEDSKLENRGLFSTEVISMYINLSPVLE